VEAMHVFATDTPFLEEVHGPAVHAHGADGQDDNERPARLFGELNFAGDLVTHAHVEIFERVTQAWLELRMPPCLAPVQISAGNLAQAIDLRQVPACGEEILEHGATQCSHEIHGFIPDVC